MDRTIEVEYQDMMDTLAEEYYNYYDTLPTPPPETPEDKERRKQRDQIDSLKARSKSVVAYYSNEIKRLRSVAPINCTPYIDSVDMECAKVVNAKDDIIGGQIELINSLDSARIVLDSIKAKQRRIIEQDSMYIAATNKKIAEFPKQLKKAEQKGQRKGFLKGTIFGALLDRGFDLLTN